MQPVIPTCHCDRLQGVWQSRGLLRHSIPRNDREKLHNDREKPRNDREKLPNDKRESHPSSDKNQPKQSEHKQNPGCIESQIR